MHTHILYYHFFKHSNPSFFSVDPHKGWQGRRLKQGWRGRNRFGRNTENTIGFLSDPLAIGKGSRGWLPHFWSGRLWGRLSVSTWVGGFGQHLMTVNLRNCRCSEGCSLHGSIAYKGEVSGSRANRVDHSRAVFPSTVLGMRVWCPFLEAQSLEARAPRTLWLHAFPSPLEWNFFGVNDKTFRVILGLHHGLGSCFTCQVLTDLFWIRGYKAKNEARKKRRR